jgi:hypothetical protein
MRKSLRAAALRRSVCTQLSGFSGIGDLTDSVQVAPRFYTWPLDYGFGASFDRSSWPTCQPATMKEAGASNLN